MGNLCKTLRMCSCLFPVSSDLKNTITTLMHNVFNDILIFIDHWRWWWFWTRLFLKWQVRIWKLENRKEQNCKANRFGYIHNLQLKFYRFDLHRFKITFNVKQLCVIVWFIIQPNVHRNNSRSRRRSLVSKSKLFNALIERS